VNPELAARLQGFGIDSFPTEKGYTLLTRGDCAAMAHGPQFGSSGIMTPSGLAYLQWRDGRAYLASHGGNETLATPEQVEAVQRFSADLKAALA
jgi:hypothetical protein